MPVLWCDPHQTLWVELEEELESERGAEEGWKFVEPVFWDVVFVVVVPLRVEGLRPVFAESLPL